MEVAGNSTLGSGHVPAWLQSWALPSAQVPFGRVPGRYCLLRASPVQERMATTTSNQEDPL